MQSNAPTYSPGYKAGKLPPFVPGKRIITQTDPEWLLLDAPAAAVTDIREQVTPHIPTMRKLMETRRGMSLAAPQVGLPLRFFIYGGKHCGSAFISVITNPRIIAESEETEEVVEGCLSLPGVKNKVKRPAWIEAEWLDAMGEPQTHALEGMRARIFHFNVELIDGKAMQR